MSDEKNKDGQISELDRVFTELLAHVQKPYDPHAEHFYRLTPRGTLIQAIDLLKMKISVLKHDLNSSESTVAMLKNDMRKLKEENRELRKRWAKNCKQITVLNKKIKSMERSKARAKRKEQKRYFHEGPTKPMSREEIMAMDKEERVGAGLHGRDD